MRRIIFLDFDGVVAPIKRWDRYGDLDPACVQVLNEIVTQCPAEIVVSSTWRHGRTVAELQALLEAQGFVGRVVDTTPSFEAHNDRGEEIGAWLAENDVAGYVIIDDHSVGRALEPRLVVTQPWNGLQPAHVPLAIAVLRGEPC